jgi:hypothetical protein
MTTFNEREMAYEAMFARDQELRFRARARRDKEFGAWVAAQLGIKGADAEDYAKELLRANLKHPGDAALVKMVLDEFKAKGVSMDELTLKKKLVELMVLPV